MPLLTSTPILFVHGFPLDHHMWDGQAELEPDFPLLRPDLPGFGDGPPPDGSPGMAGYVRSLVQVLDAAKAPKAVICGLSMGGYIAFEFWRRHPERFAALILADTRAEADDESGRQGRQAAIEKVRQGDREGALTPLFEKLLAPEAYRRIDLLKPLREMLGRASAEGIIAALEAMHDRADSVTTLPTINVPTLICVGEKDVLTPPTFAETMHRGISGSRLVQIQNAGHMAPFENPRAFNGEVRSFLTSG